MEASSGPTGFSFIKVSFMKKTSFISLLYYS
jgi:hypothetical protein